MMYKKILIANDGSDGAKYALKVAIDLARRYKAELHRKALTLHGDCREVGLLQTDTFS
jgi:nucleotide-binding universal stress UspA family protein